MVAWVFQGVPRLSRIVPGDRRKFRTVSMAFRGLQGFPGVFQGISGSFSCIKDAPECFNGFQVVLEAFQEILEDLKAT